MIIACHNASIEYEFLNDNHNSFAYKRRGYELALRFLGKNDSLTQRLHEILNQN